MKRNFKTQYDERERRVANPGSRMVKKYSGRYDEHGRIILEETGEENLYDYIQSFKDSTDIHVLLKRYANGDSEALAKVQGFYADVTEMPKNFAEVLNIVNDGENFFASLPVEIRSKFGHNFGEFMVAVSDGSIFGKLGLEKPAEPEKSPENPVEEVLPE